LIEGERIGESVGSADLATVSTVDCVLIYIVENEQYFLFVASLSSLFILLRLLIDFRQFYL